MKNWLIVGVLAALGSAALAQDCVEYETYLRLHGTLPIGGESRGLLLENDLLYVATRQSGLAILDVSDPGMPVVVSQTLLEQGHSWDMIKIEDWLYMAAGSGGLTVIDVTESAHPEVGFSFPIRTWCMDVMQVGDYLFISDYDAGVMVVDNETIWNPQILGYLPASAFSLGLAYYEDTWAGVRLVIAAAGTAGVQVYEYTPGEDTFTDRGLIDTPGYARDVVVHGGKVWVLDGPGGIHRLVLDDLDAIELADSVPVQDYASRLVFDGNTGFLADGAAGLRILDFSGAGAPTLVSSIDAPNWTYDVATNGDYTYLANGLSDVRIIDTHILDAPPRNWTLELDAPATAVRTSTGLGFLPPTLFLASEGLQVYDLSDAAAPAFLDVLQEGEDITAMDASEGELVTGTVDGMLTLYSHGIMGQMPEMWSSAQLAGSIQSVLLLDTTLVVAEGLELHHVDPAYIPLEIMQTLTTAGAVHGMALQEFVDEGQSRSYVVAAEGTAGLCFYSLADGVLSGPVATVESIGDVRSVVAHGNYLYAGNEARQLLTLGHFNPGHPSLINTQKATGAVRDLLVDEDVLTVAQDSAGVQLYDLGSPWAPRYMGSIDTEGTSVDLAAGMDFLLAADGAGGCFSFPKQCQTSVAVDEPAVGVADFALLAATPNPFNPTTLLAWTLESAGPARLTVHNLLGQQVAVLHDGPAAAGRHEARFDGSGLASGVYVVRLEQAGRSLAQPISLLK